MANEQTSVPLFAASEILTAANMNISAGTGVPVFTNSTTRDAAFGGAGEKVLAEGQLCYLSDSNIVQYYSGASWLTVGPTTAASYQYAEVLTLQTTTSTSYTDLATVGPSITATTGTTALVTFTVTTDATTIASDQGFASVAVSGATTVAANDNYSTVTRLGGSFVTESRTYGFTGLTAGSNVFTLKYKNSSGATSRFQNRGLVVWGF
jgi:hypothetical protein